MRTVVVVKPGERFLDLLLRNVIFSPCIEPERSRTTPRGWLAGSIMRLAGRRILRRQFEGSLGRFG